MKLNWNFLGGAGVQNKKPSVGGVQIFSGTAQSKLACNSQLPNLGEKSENSISILKCDHSKCCKQNGTIPDVSPSG